MNPLGARQLSILPTNSLSSEQDGIPSADDAGAADGEKPASNDSAGTTAIEQPTINGTVKYNHNIYNHLTDTEIRDQEHMTESTQPKPAVKDAQDLAAIEKVAVKGSGQALSSDALKGHIDPDTGSFLYEVWKPNGLETKSSRLMVVWILMRLRSLVLGDLSEYNATIRILAPYSICAKNSMFGRVQRLSRRQKKVEIV